MRLVVAGSHMPHAYCDEESLTDGCNPTIHTGCTDMAQVSTEDNARTSSLDTHSHPAVSAQSSHDKTPPLDFSIESIIHSDHSFNASWPLHSTPHHSPDPRDGAPHAAANPDYQYVMDEYQYTLMPAMTQLKLNAKTVPSQPTITGLVENSVYNGDNVTPHTMDIPTDNMTCTPDSDINDHRQSTGYSYFGNPGHFGDTVTWTAAPSAIGDATDLTNTSSSKKMRPYVRIQKPPYSYAAMCVMAIENAADNKLTMAGVRQAISEMFPFFCSCPKSWQDSVRHTLSRNDYFYRESSTEQGAKGERVVSYWQVDLTGVNPVIFKRQRNGDFSNYQPTLHEQLGVPEVTVPRRTEALETRLLMAAYGRVVRNQALSKLVKPQPEISTTLVPSSTPSVQAPGKEGTPPHVPKTLAPGPNINDLYLPHKPTGNNANQANVQACDDDDFLNARGDCFDDRGEDSANRDNGGLAHNQPDSKLPAIPSFLTEAWYTKSCQPVRDRAQGVKRTCTDTEADTDPKRQKMSDESISNNPQLYDTTFQQPTSYAHPGAPTTHQSTRHGCMATYADWYQPASWASGIYHFGQWYNPATAMYAGQSMYPEMYPGYSTWPYTSVPASMQASLHPSVDQHQHGGSQLPRATNPYAWYQTPSSTAANGDVKTEETGERNNPTEETVVNVVSAE